MLMFSAPADKQKYLIMLNPPWLSAYALESFFRSFLSNKLFSKTLISSLVVVVVDEVVVGVVVVVEEVVVLVVEEVVVVVVEEGVVVVVDKVVVGFGGGVAGFGAT